MRLVPEAEKAKLLLSEQVESSQFGLAELIGCRIGERNGEVGGDEGLDVGGEEEDENEERDEDEEDEEPLGEQVVQLEGGETTS